MGIVGDDDTPRNTGAFARPLARMHLRQARLGDDLFEALLERIFPHWIDRVRADSSALNCLG